MRRPYPRLAAACALAVATAVCVTGSAIAGGNPNAPGQQKKDDQAQTQQATPQQAPTQQPTQSQVPPVQQNSVSSSSTSSSTSSHVAPGQAKKASSSSSTTSSSSTQHGSSHASVQASTSTQAGVKPSSTTTHWTHCTTGSSASGATCTSSDNGHTPQTGSDVSKRYGNGKTAAQIAVSRGGSGVQLTGPGNSQPHKVSVCGKPNNKSGGVDVHAVKSYSNANCTPAKPQTQAPTAPCGYVVVATTVLGGKSHGHGKGLEHNKHMTSSTTYSLRPDSSQNCSSVSAATTVTLPGTTTTLPSTTTTLPGTTTTLPGTTTTVPGTTTTVQGASTTVQGTSTTVQGTTTTTAAAGVAGASTTSSNVAKSGVLGASKTLKPQHAPAHRGVLGTVTHVAGTTLPFTGFPVWLVVVIALALILAGLALRRRGGYSARL